ncbi:uncharacterized protein BJ171DRAFT_464350 [Polychytrium aggregatum]|uniref:uncharacterized protein n=1 Tax=Polychytrium aggregatum TaxID=110093 RepID=UPI0022FE78AA|nr:uncharacterized protein BJ171DRAFT_464828 [Polychytrium aggregatum]XP_052962426.1 uncharacterized protein BJ171DRAFT_464350 [Polychytrium aggregatum]KAI9193296.1 hypothetical protein BJ171DRAFT_464828 [Polychytrium aggregatum]KAI9193488.1 hypothetical protein BJ171DRAFT_464350 [Polychytrium aggregatum]
MCFVLDSNSICGPDFNGYQFYSTDQYANSADFNTYVSALVVSVQNVTTSFVGTRACLPAVSQSISNQLRYQLSSFCGRVAYLSYNGSNACPQTKSPPPFLCPDQCKFAYTTLTTVYNDVSVCPATTSSSAMQSRNQSINNVIEYCNNALTLQTSNPSVQCYAGAPLEVSNSDCGFRDQSSRIAGCQLIPNDPCCMALNGNNNTNNGNTSGGSPIGIIVGSILGVLALVGIVVAVWIVRRRRLQKAYNYQTDYTQHQTYASTGNSNNNIPIAPLKSALSSRSQQPDSLSVLTSVGAAAVAQAPPASKAAPGAAAASIELSQAIPGATAAQNVMRVVHPYAPTLADELELEVGHDVIVIRSFDDGWALGLVPTTGKQGAFPLVCVARPEDVVAFELANGGQRFSTATSSDIQFNKRMSSQIISAEDIEAVAKMVVQQRSTMINANGEVRLQ